MHRQAEGSRIRETCDLVRAGRWYDAAPQPNRAADLVWLEEESEELLADLCEDVLAGARDRYSAAEVTLLTPRVTGGHRRQRAVANGGAEPPAATSLQS